MSNKICIVCCSDLQKGKRKFCSLNCQNKYRNPSTTKVCGFCKKVFLTKKSIQKFCDFECNRGAATLRAKIRRNERKQVLDKECAFCKDSFITNASRQKFCSAKCRSRDFEQKPHRKHGFNRKKSHLRSQLKPFGLSVEDYEFELQNQNYVCAICGEFETTTHQGTLRRLAVDHDHKTGCYRGLLCGNCNKGIGLFKDNVALLKQAIRYLEKFEGM